ncbi:unnamed protein product [Protopolystoma xenopodis]|uniref:Uncharacterized protein n=1 Tax=Protopolystoma xenopodis TaxID=117903 RepID=A0A3S5CNZ0_9PLAT|nr:unnamed protein product [Protopolystoma xenopodis]
MFNYILKRLHANSSASPSCLRSHGGLTTCSSDCRLVGRVGGGLPSQKEGIVCYNSTAPKFHAQPLGCLASICPRSLVGLGISPTPPPHVTLSQGGRDNQTNERNELHANGQENVGQALRPDNSTYPQDHCCTHYGRDDENKDFAHLNVAAAATGDDDDNDNDNDDDGDGDDDDTSHDDTSADFVSASRDK